MHYQIKQKWVKTLRSGQFKQTREALYNPNSKGLDALGVLCKLYADRYGLSLEEVIPFRDAPALPDRVREWAQLRESDPTIRLKTKETTLVGLNDVTKLNFHQIADYIEKQL